jgi:hypothetical protein
MNIVHILVGLVLLLFGRKLFWLFVGYAGFVVSFNYAHQILDVPPGLIPFLIALGVGIIGAILAIFLQQIAIVLSGFFAGGYLTVNIVQRLGYYSIQRFWWLYLLGGVLGAVLLWVIFDYALIFLSSVIGAFTVITANIFQPQINSIVFVALFVIGVIVQILQLRKEIETSRE